MGWNTNTQWPSDTNLSKNRMKIKILTENINKWVNGTREGHEQMFEKLNIFIKILKNK